MLAARYARAYVDVNREPYELDAGMFEDDLPEFARGRTARVAAGLGSIARLVAEGREIYDRKLTFAEARGGAHVGGIMPSGVGRGEHQGRDRRAGRPLAAPQVERRFERGDDRRGGQFPSIHDELVRA